MVSVGETMGVKETISAIKERGVYLEVPLRRNIEEEISNRLSSGKITKAEAEEVKKYFDDDMIFALSKRDAIDFMRNYYLGDELAIDSYESGTNKKLHKLLEGTNLTLKEIYEAAKLADVDCKIQKAKLSKAEKEAGKRGETTRSELHNIQNFLNAKIKEHGGTKELSEKETIKIMEDIVGLEEDREINPLKLAVSVITLGHIWEQVVDVFSKDDFLKHFNTSPVNEKAYGDQSEAYGSPRNKLEAKVRRFDAEF